MLEMLGEFGYVCGMLGLCYKLESSCIILHQYLRN